MLAVPAAVTALTAALCWTSPGTARRALPAVAVVGAHDIDAELDLADNLGRSDIAQAERALGLGMTALGALVYAAVLRGKGRLHRRRVFFRACAKNTACHRSREAVCAAVSHSR